VLHPSFCTEWFRNLAPKHDNKACQEAIDKAAALFRHVAGTYHESSPPEANQIPASSTPCLSNNEGSFLASMLHVHIAEVTPKATETPEDKFTDKV
jgi:hypothetical protein